MKETPIIILTGSLDPKVCEEAKNIGAFECFEKPFTESDIRRLERMLEERRIERLAYAQKGDGRGA
jgi:FixJ family two-component response regulator